MKSLELQVQDINKKLQQFIKQHIALQKENMVLTQKIHERGEEAKTKDERINFLEMQMSILKASSGKMNEEERIGFEKRINQHIKDLEKCMTMLNK
ncbi:MAG: hypothetical protein ABJA90_08070 [Ginsengibacter sp.]